MKAFAESGGLFAWLDWELLLLIGSSRLANGAEDRSVIE
jgi:hypothetical protein